MAQHTNTATKASGHRDDLYRHLLIICVFAAVLANMIFGFDASADAARLIQAMRQSQNEVIVFLLFFLTYFAGFAKARRWSVCDGGVSKVTSPRPPASKHLPKVTVGPTQGVAAAKISVPAMKRLGQWDADTHLIKMTDRACLPTDASTFSELVGACARLNTTDLALSLFDHMLKSGIACDSQSISSGNASKFFKLVASNLDDKRMQKDGIQLMRTIVAHGLSPTNLIQNQLIRSWKSKLPEHVVEMFLNLREQGVHLSATAYRCVMTAHERTEPAFTLQLYDEIVERDVKIDRVAFNAVLCACSHLGMTEKALELFEQMPAHGLEPNGKTYGALIKACTDAGRAKEALHFFESMRAAGFEANCFALRDAIRCCVNLGKLEEAYELYQSMVRISTVPCCSTFNTYILEACQKSGYPSIPDRIQANTTWTGPGDAMCSEDACATAHAVDADLASQ